MTAGRAAARWIVPLAGAVLLIALFVWLGPGRILELFGIIGINLLAICALFVCHECVRALALARCLGPGGHVPFRRLLWIRFMGEAVRTLTHSGPLLAEPARAWMLARDAAESAHAFGAAISELLANSLTSSAVTVAVLAFVLQTSDLGRPLAALASVILWLSLAYLVVALAALAGRVYLIGALARGAGALPLIGQRLKTNPARVRRMEDAVFLALRDRPGTLLQVFGLELIAQAILVLEVYWTLISMGLAISPGTALLVEALTKMANTIQSIGAAEGAYAIVFDWLGMTAVVGFTLSLVKRLRSAIVAPLGLGVLAAFDRRRPAEHGPASEPKR